MVTLLRDEHATRLWSAPYTYAEVGGTANPDAPAGYRCVRRTRDLRGRAFEAAAEALMGWQLQERAGLRVAASSPRVEPGAVVVLRLGLGPVSLRIPCRVVYVLDEPDRVGFAYGTLPGHPESGEERFVLERHDAGWPVLSISAFSRPTTTFARVGGPVTRWAQDLMTERYLRALGSS